MNAYYPQPNQCDVALETQPEWQETPANLRDLYIQANASTGASGVSAVNSYSSSASSSAGSNSGTTSVLYTPSSATLTPPANALSTNNSTSLHTYTSSTAANAVPLNALTRLSTPTE